MHKPGIDVLMNPRSVAVVGASDDPSRAGGRPLHYLLRGGFAGRIVPVNPRRDRVQGISAVPSIRDLDQPVDCAVLVVGADQMVETLRDCADKGVRSAVIFAAGFGEGGPEGVQRQHQMSAIARAANMRLLGPNCLGLYNLGSRAFLTMSGLFQDGFPATGALAVASQSGGYAGQLAYVARQRGIEIGAWVTTGNEADVDLAEVLEHYAADPTITTVLAYIEGVKHGPRFISALAALRAARKPVIAFKVGSSTRGAQAVASHTAAMSGEDAVYDAVFAEYGVQRVQSTEEALDIAYAARFGLPRGRRYAAVGTSGGIGGQMADLAQANGLQMPPTEPALRAELAAIAPLGSAQNPVDVSGQVVNDPTIMGRSLAALAASGQYDILHGFIGFSAGIGWLAEPYRATMTQAAAQAPPGTLRIASISGAPDLIAAYEAAGYAVFEEPARAVRASAALASIADAFARTGQGAAAGTALPSGGPSDAASAGRAVLEAAGIPLPRSRTCATPADAAQAAAEIGGLLALKIVSPDIAHKTELGGVALGLAPDAVAQAAERMLATVSQRAPNARIEGFEVGEMVTDGVECVLAWRHDPVFGPVVTVGMGGVLVELLQDTVISLAPVTPLAARAMIGRLRARPLLDGFRGAPPADVEALAEAVARLSGVALTASAAIPEFEINPLLVRPAGQGVIALDVLAHLKEAP